MKIKDLTLSRFVVIPADTAVWQALGILKDADTKYALITEGSTAKGFVLKDTLPGVDGSVIGSFIQSFHGEIHQDAELKLEKLTGPMLVFNHPGQYIGILDTDALVVSLLDLDRHNIELAGEIDAIINFSSDEIYVTDGNGVTLRVNKAFEENSGVPLEEVLYKKVTDLEEQGFFKPSVARLVLEQKNKVTVMQEYKNKKKVLVTGTPVFAMNGSIFRVIINTRDTSKLNLLKAQLEEIENLKERLYQELLNLRNDQMPVDHIVAYSSSMSQVLDMARRVAEVDSTVLILGETGVGKGLLAHYIHDNSPHKNNSFIAINCGAIPENLLESELFGYEPGAFTGAHRKGKMGKIELANQGTLFLDEIGDLPPALQVKLLHVLQEGMITRIGGTKDIALNVHILAATNRDLTRMVKEGAFRQDLYYRLNVIPLEIPPLRKRIEDLEPLANKFLKKFNQKYRKEKIISSATLTFLQNYHWPGNIRELENLIERLAIVVGEDTIEPYHLPETIKMANLSQGHAEIMETVRPLNKLKDELEKQILRNLYSQFGNTYKIAKFLKINQSTVVRKLNKYDIKK
jgi:TyrR family helix-turn-helix protein/PAS domain S-box-containing protein